MTEQQARVGLGVVIINKEKKILLGLRKGNHVPDVWCPPGGHLEFGETFEECARREAEEETGLKIGKVKPISVKNNFYLKEGKHYVTVITKGEYIGGKPKIMEPEKCQEWKWFSYKDIPKKLIPPFRDLIHGGFKF